MKENYIEGFPEMPEMNWELSKENWTPFYGNNHNKIQRPDIWAGGGVSFDRIIGKPLSQELWEDLVHRLLITGLCIYQYDESQWACCWPEGHCIINLNEQKNVKSIYFVPFHHSLSKRID